MAKSQENINKPQVIVTANAAYIIMSAHNYGLVLSWPRTEQARYAHSLFRHDMSTNYVDDKQISGRSETVTFRTAVTFYGV